MIRVHIRGPGRRPGSRSRRSGRAGREDPPEPDPAEPREARGGRMRPPLPKSAAGSKPKGLPRTGSSSSSSVRRRPARRRGSSDVPSSLSLRERAGPPGREESAWWNPPRTRSSRLASSFEAPGASSPSGLSLDSSSGLVLTITPCLGRRARRAELAARGAPNGPIVPQVAAGPKTRAAPGRGTGRDRDARRGIRHCACSTEPTAVPTTALFSRWPLRAPPRRPETRSGTRGAVRRRVSAPGGVGRRHPGRRAGGGAPLLPGGVDSVMSPQVALCEAGSRGSSWGGFRRAGLARREVGWTSSRWARIAQAGPGPSWPRPRDLVERSWNYASRPAPPRPAITT